MSTIYISAVLAKVVEVTGEAAYGQTSKEQMVAWLCEGETIIVKEKPDAFTKVATEQMAAGTRQTLASDGLLFLMPVCNMGTDGNTPGDVVYLADMDQLNRSNPAWHSATGNAAINSICFNLNDPKAFYVSPPQPEADQGFLRYVYSAIPPVITITAENYDVTFNLGDEYAPNLVNYILARVYSKDAGQMLGADALSRAQTYNSLFVNSLREQDAIEEIKDPNKKV